jgi:hypothetical protein
VELRLTAQAEADAWQQSADAHIRDDPAGSASAKALARQLASRREQLEAANARYEKWATDTGSRREAAGKGWAAAVALVSFSSVMIPVPTSAATCARPRAADRVITRCITRSKPMSGFVRTPAASARACPRSASARHPAATWSTRTLLSGTFSAPAIRTSAAGRCTGRRCLAVPGKPQAGQPVLPAAGLPTFAVGAHPATGSNQGPGAINVVVQCGGVTVRPGDVICGDASGLVVVPREHLAPVLALTKTVADREVSWRQAIADGASMPAATGIDDLISKLAPDRD